MNVPHVSIYDKDKKKYLLSVSLPHKETLVGFVAASYPILKDLEKYGRRNVVVFISEDIENYFLLKDIEYENIVENSLGKLEDKEYGQWLKSGNDTYNLYKFTTPYFYQGIITICDYYNVDFRDYIKGCCFDKMGNNYSLNGYIMFNTQVYSDTLDDNDDDEEKDNENLIPLIRDDDY